MRQTQKGAGKFKRQKPKVNKSHRRRVKYQNPYSYLADRSSPPSIEMDVPNSMNGRRTQDINTGNIITEPRRRTQTTMGEQYRNNLEKASRRTSTRHQRKIANKRVDDLAGLFGKATL
jgi:hypothetical protein